MGLPEGDKSQLLHESVAYALLRIERFKHGVRRLEAIINMYTIRRGEPIGPSDLPSMDQLEMHVDGGKLLLHIEEWPLRKYPIDAASSLIESGSTTVLKP